MIDSSPLKSSGECAALGQSYVDCLQEIADSSDDSQESSGALSHHTQKIEEHRGHGLDDAPTDVQDGKQSAKYPPEIVDGFEETA
jgi:hypothetical protein